MPKRFLRNLAPLLVLATACQPTDVAVKPKAKVAASAKPVASPVAAAAPKVLAKPKDAFRTLAGQVVIDARYVQDRKAGQLISNNGGSVIAVGDGAAALPTGANVISNNGSSLISDNGGGVISDQGSAFRLLAEAPATSFGTTAPAAGMALRVLDLQANKPLSLGVDAAGQPVYEVRSDAAGRFEVYLPTGVGASVLLTAAAPGATDRRLRYENLASSAKVAVDEDTARASETVREGYGIGFQGLFKPLDPADAALPNEEPANRPAILAGLARLREALKAVHADAWDEQKKKDVAQRLADLVIARYTPETTPIDRAHGFPPYDGPLESTFSAYAGLLREEREGVTKKMQALADQGQDPLAYFNERPYIVRARQAHGVDYEIKKPADWVFVINHTYLDSSKENLAQTFTFGAEAFGDIGLDFSHFGRYVAALRGDGIAANRILFLDPASGALDEALKVIAAS